MTVKRALISVSDKDQLLPFAKNLSERGIEILSTGGTKAFLETAGIPVTAVDDVTGFPEILDGRVKTLHPAIHGGILAIRENNTHMDAIQNHAIKPIDLVAVNLYPFKETVSKPGVAYEDAIENIDIGGPSMIRSAAKNHRDVTVVCDPSDYEAVVSALDEFEEVPFFLKQKLAAKAYRHTAAYDALIADYFMKETHEPFPESLTLTFEKKQDLRYGENPHQNAAFYTAPSAAEGSIASAKQLHGKELSYNNLRDADAALGMLSEYDAPTVVAVKHMNPCGIGAGLSIQDAFQEAYAADPVSIFGGIIAANREIDEATAEQLHDIFLEIIIAPSFSAKALDILTKKKNLRLLTVDIKTADAKAPLYTSVNGGLLVQESDAPGMGDTVLQQATERAVSETEYENLILAWRAVKHVKSNAIVLVKDGRTVGIGAGQMNRVGAAKIAIEQAGEQAKGAVMASDAFFPMNDTVEAAANAGITAIIQPGGSIKDKDSVDMANEHGLAMVFTGKRHFKH